ncbi:MAG: aryldialkylphosphatase [Verrucomicrobia bacterium]|nr:aryldialkylphosphatase [Verrucomicrobiota bacterium]
MTFVRTVLSDITPAQLGRCYAHEHVIIGPSFTTHVCPEFLLDDVDRAAAELADFRRAGGGAMVDSMPCDSGRDILRLAEVSRRSGVHLICPTGLHLAKYYPPGHWGETLGAAELAALFVADITEGVDAFDYGAPVVRRTPHRAGVIKVATERQFTARDEKLLAAAAEAHCRTGCPILTHTEQGELALEQATRLRELGVDLRHVCLSHVDRRPDPGYHREVLSTGVRLEYDSAFRWPAERGNPTRDLLLALLPEFPDQLMLGMDAARRSYWRSYGGAPGLVFLLETFVPELRAAGLSDELLSRVLLATPASTYAFARAA